MSMQIQKIILYHASGKKQIIPFKLGTVNIITGSSDTGKSAIIPIIEYCLGQSEFNVPGTIIRKAVAWYAVIYQFQDIQVFIAKRSPIRGTYQGQVCYKEGIKLTIPELNELKPEHNDRQVKERLLQLLSLPTNSDIRNNLKVSEHVKTTIDNALFYLFQNQGTIANSEVLFHRQQGAAQKIKETLPYFLGVVEETYSKFQQQLDEAKDQLKTIERQIDEKQHVIQKTLTDGQNLIIESKRVGLIERDGMPDRQDEIIALLKTAMQKKLEPEMLPFPSVTGDDQLSQLDRDIEELEQKRVEIGNEISRIRLYAKDAEQYTDAVHEHLARLESIHLFENQDNQLDLLEDVLSKRCPLCSSELTNPTVKIDAINRALFDLHRNLNLTERKKPHLDSTIQNRKQQQERIGRQIRQKEIIVDKILEERDQKKSLLQQIRDANNETNRVINWIEYYLKTLETTDSTILLQRQVEDIAQQIEDYKRQISSYSFKRRQGFILQELNMLMTAWAKRLELQGSNTNSYQFDIEKLTVNTREGQEIIPMQQMGGHENHLGCHLILLLALHKYFVEKQCPVPRFLILDQPAQGYFPELNVYQHAMETNKDSDMVAVRRMFDFLFDVCETLSPNFQLIILEHAKLEDNPRFQNALVEGCTWTGSGTHALIPESWVVKELQNERPDQLSL